MTISEKIVNRLLENHVVYGKEVPTLEQVAACFVNPSKELDKALSYFYLGDANGKKPYCAIDKNSNLIHVYFLYDYHGAFVQKGLEISIGEEGVLTVTDWPPGDFYSYKDKSKERAFSALDLENVKAALENQLGSYPQQPKPVTKEDVLKAAADPNSELSRVLGNCKPEPYVGDEILIRTGAKSGFKIDFREPNEHWPRGFCVTNAGYAGFQYTFTPRAKEIAKQVEACLKELNKVSNPKVYDPFDL